MLRKTLPLLALSVACAAEPQEDKNISPDLSEKTSKTTWHDLPCEIQANIISKLPLSSLRETLLADKKCYQLGLAEIDKRLTQPIRISFLDNARYNISGLAEVRVCLTSKTQGTSHVYAFNYEQNKRITPKGCPQDFTDRLFKDSFPLKVTIDCISGYIDAENREFASYWQDIKNKFIGTFNLKALERNNKPLEAIRFNRTGFSYRYTD